MVTSTPAKVRKINDYGQSKPPFPLPKKGLNRGKPSFKRYRPAGLIRTAHRPVLPYKAGEE